MHKYHVKSTLHLKISEIPSYSPFDEAGAAQPVRGGGGAGSAGGGGGVPARRPRDGATAGVRGAPPGDRQEQDQAGEGDHDTGGRGVGERERRWQ